MISVPKITLGNAIVPDLVWLSGPGSPILKISGIQDLPTSPKEQLNMALENN